MPSASCSCRPSSGASSPVGFAAPSNDCIEACAAAGLARRLLGFGPSSVPLMPDWNMIRYMNTCELVGDERHVETDESPSSHRATDLSRRHGPATRAQVEVGGGTV